MDVMIRFATRTGDSTFDLIDPEFFRPHAMIACRAAMRGDVVQCFDGRRNRRVELNGGRLQVAKALHMGSAECTARYGSGKHKDDDEPLK
jgi:hypothetical protein